jgi:streptogramin lyase
MRRAFVTCITAALVTVAVASSSHGAADGSVPEARAFKICAGAGPYWPTETLAIKGSRAWIACKEQSRLVRLDLRRGRVVGSVRLGGPVIAVTTGFGSVWALDTASTLYRINARTGRVGRRIALGASVPYNLWIGAGSVWAVDDGAGTVIRVSPRTNRVLKRIPVGDGAADMVFSGTTAWVVNHRDLGLVRLDTRTNKPTRLTTLQADAPERIALLAGSLWITGRGTDLLQVKPESGEVTRTIEIGGSGIDVVAVAGALWVPARSVAVDASGFPTMEALRRVSLDGAVKIAAMARGHVDVHGLAAGPGGTSVWFADNTAGRLYRLPSSG